MHWRLSRKHRANQQLQMADEQKLYRIGEVSRITATKAFVLRYWETEFPMLQPVKSPHGQRLYRRQDVEMVLEIKRLLYEEGFTIAGARKHLEEGNGAAQGRKENVKSQISDSREEPLVGARGRKALAQLYDELHAILKKLEKD